MKWVTEWGLPHKVNAKRFKFRYGFNEDYNLQSEIDSNHDGTD